MDIILDGFLGASYNVKEKIDTNEECEKVLKYYYSFFESGNIINDIKFTQKSADGLYKFESGVKIINIKEEMPYMETSIRNISLSRTYAVIVQRVDHDQGIVYVSHKKAQEMVRPAAIEKINRVLDNNDVSKVLGRVVYVSDKTNMCIIDIMGLDIRGILRIQDWSYAHTGKLTNEVKYGDVIEVTIFKKAQNYKDAMPCYCVSRKMALKDPWEGIEDRVPYHSNVVVICVSKQTNNYVGKIDGIEDISAFCFYPDQNSDLVIKIGKKYEGYVKSVSEKRRVLRIKTLKEIN